MHSVAFSCDGELAVAADNSVHIFVPHFPDFSTSPKKAARADNLNGHGGEQTAGPDDTGDSVAEEGKPRDDDGNFQDGPEVPPQYSGVGKRIPVSTLPANPRVNRELFAAAGVPFPYDHPELFTDSEEGDEDEDQDPTSEVDADEKHRDEKTGSKRRRRSSSEDSNVARGAGSGPITGPGTSDNHLISLAWSPSDLGVNRRPVLAVLTAIGAVTVYGDGDFGDGNGNGNGDGGDDVGQISSLGRPMLRDGMLPRRDVGGWKLLWGVGERLFVPGQQAELAEDIEAFAWAPYVAPGQALMACINNGQEASIISVQTVPAGQHDAELRVGGSEGRLLWKVHEVARFPAQGPHRDPRDPGWIPWGTSWGISWGPWLLHADGSRTCLLSYVDRNYVGFKSVTVGSPWSRGKIPDVTVSDSNAGFCFRLYTDSFVEFENAIWTNGQSKICRGLIATPFEVSVFKIDLLQHGHVQSPHDTVYCETAAPDSIGTYDLPNSNPIVGLIIHPPDPLKRTYTPFYTLVRLSATGRSRRWFDTNVSLSEDSALDTKPQWLTDICEKLSISVPQNVLRHQSFDRGSESSGSDSWDSAEDDHLEDDDDPVTLDLQNYVEVSDDESAKNVRGGPELHPHRFRVWGLAASPGWGVSALLVSPHTTHRPETGALHNMRSTVYFGYQPHAETAASNDTRRGDGEPAAQEVAGTASELTLLSQPQHMSTEGRLFEWMYGNGPDVPGITTATGQVTGYGGGQEEGSVAASAAKRARRTSLLRPLLDAQKCAICGAALQRPKPPRSNHRDDGGSAGPAPPLTTCERGHFFSTCGTTGLAIQAPGTARRCGVCGARTLRARALLAQFPAARRAEILEAVEAVMEEVCGGVAESFSTERVTVYKTS